MPTFSIIVPVYNVERYIKACLDSVFNQTEKDYEVIVVNDGTCDNSMEIVKDYDVKVINQKNQGLSTARNNGAKRAKGKYIIFLDSDDYLEKDTLKEIKKLLSNEPDLVRYQIREVFEDGKKVDYHETDFLNKSGEEAFELISKYHFVENAWCYAIKRKYYVNEKFQFRNGTYHEDFGLMPLIIMKAKVVNATSYIGYNYVQRNGSIMNNNDYEKTKKKVDDFYLHYKYLKEEILKTSLKSKVFRSFIANSLVIKICELNGNDYRFYKHKLRCEKVYDDILADTLLRKFKKVIIKVSPKFYYKIR